MSQSSFYALSDEFSDDLLALVEKFCDGSAERFSAARTALLEAYHMCHATELFDEEATDGEEEK